FTASLLDYVHFLPFFFTADATTEFYTLSLHDALPILFVLVFLGIVIGGSLLLYALRAPEAGADAKPFAAGSRETLLLLNNLLLRSEEHTSELQSRENLVCRLLLEKKKIKFEH